MGRLPDFVIVGAQKAGTTAMLNSLKTHPAVDSNDPVSSDRWLRRITEPLRPNRRIVTEPHFFTYRWDRGIDWYTGLFTSDAPVVGERTPAILYQDIARRRLASTLPDAKVIAMLRHPVDRSFSQWNHYNQDPQARTWGWPGGESFADAMDADRADIRTRSAYGEQLSALYDLYPRDQLHVVISERMRDDRQGELDRVFDFLGVEPIAVPAIDRRTAHVRQYGSALDRDERDRWNAHFEDDVGSVRTMLDDPIPEWDI